MKNELSRQNICILPAACAYPTDRLAASCRQAVCVAKVHSWRAKVHSYAANVGSWERECATLPPIDAIPYARGGEQWLIRINHQQVYSYYEKLEKQVSGVSNFSPKMFIGLV